MPPLPEFDEVEYLLSRNCLSKMYAKKFGFEIEGSFLHSDFGNSSYSECDCDSDDCGCNTEEYENPHFKEDGSVHCNRSYNGSARLIEGEIASPVFRIDRLEQFEVYARRNMPEFVDYTAGVHVSISTNNDMAYSKLMDKKYFKLFRKEVKKYMNSLKIVDGIESGDFLFCEKTRLLFNDRFNGIRDTFCKNASAPDSQVNYPWNNLIPNRHGRYNCMSYPHADNGRLECRMFPSVTDSAELILMVEWFLVFTNDYLKSFVTPERKIGNEIEIDESFIETETEVLLCV